VVDDRHELNSPTHTVFLSLCLPITPTDNALALSTALTAKTTQLCLGLEDGAADILKLVPPNTAELLLWWFGDDMVAARGESLADSGGLTFQAGQRQAILNVIVANNVLGRNRRHWSLLNLYKAAVLNALLSVNRLKEVAQDNDAHLQYSFKMATGTGKTWLLQALMIWHLLNKSAALAEGIYDVRFTWQLLVGAPKLVVYERLLDASAAS
jgi:type III restriction enzyme